MSLYYTKERNTQMLLSLMKAHGVKKVIASPGTTNVAFVGSIQQDPYFELYSSVDERSAAYMACGMAAESGEPVALTCTGATASRNYVPGLTEAFYRKLPVLAVTSAQHIGRVGQNIPQVIDRSSPMPDIVRCSVQIPAIHDSEDEWACNVLLNKALLELRHRGGGPVHINLTTEYTRDFSIKSLPDTRVIRRITCQDPMPALPGGPVGIFVGAHKPWTAEETGLVERFCEQHNAVVLCDHTSNYPGRYGLWPSILTSQDALEVPLKEFDLLIDLGDVSGAYMDLRPRQVWRVNPDGEVRDTFRKLTCVFEMEESEFFRRCTAEEGPADTSRYEAWRREIARMRGRIAELPFSNIWVAQQTISRLPEGSRLHLGILNSLRSWNFFEKDGGISASSNTGGFGIDGCVSSLLGASLASPDRLFFGVVGDLAFFYDLNAIGNRHVGANVRILLVNNGKGTEFRNYNHIASQFGEAADRYIAAAGHYGNQSSTLVRHYAGDLGFQYLCAATKEEYLAQLETFVSPERTERPMLLEVFTDSAAESEALKTMRTLEVSKKTEVIQTAKSMVKDAVGEKGAAFLKKMIGG